MVSGKYSAVAGAVSREQALANISNNLANVSTAGYKKMMVSFEAILRGEQQTTDANGINYNRVNRNFTDFSSGPLKQTDNVLDLAINGRGFFKVLGPDGPLYTRNGSFTLDEVGTLRTREGFPVLDEGDTPVEIAGAGGQNISINRYGTISLLDEIGNREEIGRLAVVDIADTSTLTRHDTANYTLEPGGQEELLAEPTVVSGSIELSNVNMVDEMGRMIEGKRLYELYHKVIKAYSSISEKQEALGTIS